MKKLFSIFISFVILAEIFTSSASAATKHINEKPIKSYIQKHKGIVGVYYENTTNNDSFQYQANKVTRAASTIKLPLVTYVMEQASKGKIDLNKKLTYHSYEYNEGSGIIQYDKVGTKYTIRTLVKYAVVYSDNIAFVMLRNYVGKSNFIAYCKSLGGKHLYENGVNVTTAKDMEVYMKYFQKFSKSHNLGKELEGYLTKTIYNDYIPKGIPKNVTIAHKVGMIPESDIYNDVAIVKDKHPYILVILTKDKKGPTTISGLSKIIHQEHIKANKEIKTSALKQNQIVVTNNKGEKDIIVIKGIKKNDKISIYNASKKGKRLAVQTAKNTTITLSVNQLDAKSGKIYITNKRQGMTESSRVGVSYKGEQTNPLKQTQVKAESISNHKTKITITGIQKGDVIKVYPTNGAKQYSKQFKAASSKISFELPQKDTLYLSVTNSGMLESGRIVVNIGE